MSTENTENAENAEEKAPRKFGALIDHAYDAMIPAAIFCGLIGMLLGTFPASVFAYFTGIVFFPMYISAPLIIYMLLRYLKAGRDIRAVIITAIFSLSGAYFTALSCQAALYARTYSMAIYNIPLVTMLSVGKSGVLPESASAYVYPLLFTALGAAIAWELLLEPHFKLFCKK